MAKFLYLLPTMVTANSLYERMHQFFSSYEHPVGLTHSMADLVTRHEQERMDDAVGDGQRRFAFTFPFLTATLSLL